MSNPLNQFATVLLAAVCLLGCGGKPAAPAAGDALRGDLVIFHAGSLSVPLREIAAAFNKLHPDVLVKPEAAGSRDCARKICSLKRECDVMASADYSVVDTLLVPEFASYNIRFATNEMVLVYNPKSKRTTGITAKNWPKILQQPGVLLGRADPNRDPCGYRTEMVLQLAEKHYGRADLFQTLTAKSRDKHIRPKETDLLALLEAGEIDALFIYRSVAEQHKLTFLTLPDEVNLKSAALKALYKTATVKVTGKKLGEFLTKTGSPMVYSVTIPTSAPNRAAAEAFVAFLLSPQGRAILERNGQPAIAPAPTSGFAALPELLKPLCSELQTAQ